MKVRIREEADGFWRVETKEWYDLFWQYENCFLDREGKTAYERAKEYAVRMKNLRVEEIK